MHIDVEWSGGKRKLADGYDLPWWFTQRMVEYLGIIVTELEAPRWNRLMGRKAQQALLGRRPYSTKGFVYAFDEGDSTVAAEILRHWMCLAWGLFEPARDFWLARNGIAWLDGFPTLDEEMRAARFYHHRGANTLIDRERERVGKLGDDGDLWRSFSDLDAEERAALDGVLAGRECRCDVCERVAPTPLHESRFRRSLEGEMTGYRVGLMFWLGAMRRPSPELLTCVLDRADLFARTFVSHEFTFPGAIAAVCRRQPALYEQAVAPFHQHDSSWSRAAAVGGLKGALLSGQVAFADADEPIAAALKGELNETLQMLELLGAVEIPDDMVEVCSRLFEKMVRTWWGDPDARPEILQRCLEGWAHLYPREPLPERARDFLTQIVEAVRSNAHYTHLVGKASKLLDRS